MNRLMHVKGWSRAAAYSGTMSAPPPPAPTFSATVLAGNELAQALPLIQATWPNVDQTAWRRYVGFVAQRAKASEAGVIGLRDPAGYLNGLLVYEVEQDLREGRILTVHLFTAIDLANSAAPVGALLDAATAKALDLACTALQVRVYSDQSALAVQLRGLGLSDRAGYLWQSITRSRPN